MPHFRALHEMLALLSSSRTVLIFINGETSRIEARFFETIQLNNFSGNIQLPFHGDVTE